MPLTRDFKETVQSRLVNDPLYGSELLREAVQCLVSGDVDTGKTILRDYINATVGFEALGSAVQKPPKSLMRMFSPAGNPQARNLFEVLSALQQAGGTRLEVSFKPMPKRVRSL